MRQKGREGEQKGKQKLAKDSSDHGDNCDEKAQNH
jgi:hypothetical protein